MSTNLANFLKTQSKQNDISTPVADIPLLIDQLVQNMDSRRQLFNIETLIESEIRPLSIGWIAFVCNKDDGLTIKTFTETVTNALKHVQHGLYVLLKLPHSIQSYTSPQDIINILLKLYQIIDNLSSKTHGLTFDSRIIIIYSKSMSNTLHNTYLPKITQITQCSTKITLTDNTDSINDSNICFNKYREVVFGGTFDHLHSGHKVLITIAALSCSNTLYIGLSIDQLLVKKKFSNMLQSFDKRKQVLLDFIQCIKPDLKVNIEALNDIYGPSIYESIEALVISKETIKGGTAVNTKRKELNRNPLELIVIDFILSSNETDKNGSNKTSSTAIRCFDEQYQYLYHQWNRLITDIIPKQNKNERKDDDDDDEGTSGNDKKQFIDEWWYIIFNFYQQKHRFYHTLSHIEHMLKDCITYSKDIDNVTVVLLSIWFHDIVYDATKGNNELQSVGVFEVFVKYLCSVFGDRVYEMFTKDIIDKVVCYIEATIKHQIEEKYGNDNDLKWFLDFDLGILGEHKDVYEEYAMDIRKEYIHVESPLFEQKRAAVMQRFFDRKQLYFSDVFQQKFESIARQNLRNEIQMLQNHQ